jgi:hypothetical protein
MNIKNLYLILYFKDCKGNGFAGKSEVGSRKSEVGSRKSEVGSRKTEDRSRKSEVEDPQNGADEIP